VLRPVLGDHVDRCHIVPSMTLADRIQAAPPVGVPHLVSTFHLDVWRRKGADVLAQAAVIAGRQEPGFKIDVIGGGSSASVMGLREMLRATGAEAHVHLLGPSPHEQVQARLASYAGFVLPTRRETYGMAYVEALFAGLPVVYSQGRGIDGMTPETTGRRVNPGDPADVAAGMLDMVRNEAAWKSRVAAAQADGAFDGLRAAAIGALYRGVLGGVLEAGA
jgi:glycosyltransferase involved in cell wall biosynthesis